MADAIDTAWQIVKTSDDCQIEGTDMATLVSRIEAHVLAYAADVQRQGDLIASMGDAAMDKMQAMMGQVAEQRDIALAYAAERERVLRESDEGHYLNWHVRDDDDASQRRYELLYHEAIARHNARVAAQDEGKPTT